MGYTKGIIGPKPVEKFSEGFIQEALERFFAENSVRYFMDNMFVFRWESDKLIETKTGYIYEFEIKISKADFKNDFKNKVDKHMILSGSKVCGQEYLSSFAKWYAELEERAKTSPYLRVRLANGCYDETKEQNRIDKQRKPNKYYYAVPEGLINVEEVPDYAGLIWVTNTGILIEKKKAPYIHKEKYNDAELKLGEKFYYHMVDWKRSFWSERRAHNRIVEKIQIEVDKKKQEKPYADLLDERNRYEGMYKKKMDEVFQLEDGRRKTYWHNQKVKNALVAKIKKYEPSFSLLQLENQIYEEEKKLLKG